MWRVVSAILALLVAGVAYFLNLVYQKRRDLDGLVCHPVVPNKVPTDSMIYSLNHRRTVDSGGILSLLANAENYSLLESMCRIGPIT